MKVASKTLIEELVQLTKEHMDQVELLNKKPIDELNHKASEHIWSALECIEHLNRYGDYYLPEIEKRILKSKTSPDIYFKPGFLGNYFAQSMLPKEPLNAMKTFKDKNPSGSELDKTAFERFLMQQHKMLNLLDEARHISLNKTKTSISITRLLKLKLGDTLRVVIYHNKRHILQALKTLEAKKKF